MNDTLYRPNCLRLISGKYMELDNITPDSFDLDDVIIGMAREGRWSNQARLPITVGEHTLHCYDLFPSFETLLHDAPEGILGDIPSPMKQRWPEYQLWEYQLYNCMCIKWGVMNTKPDPRVKDADIKALEWEWKNHVKFPTVLPMYHAMSENEIIGKLRILFKKHIVANQPLSWN